MKDFRSHRTGTPSLPCNRSTRVPQEGRRVFDKARTAWHQKVVKKSHSDAPHAPHALTLRRSDSPPVPGQELVDQGLADLAEDLTTDCALLVLIAAPRLKRLGI